MHVGAVREPPLLPTKPIPYILSIHAANTNQKSHQSLKSAQIHGSEQDPP